MHSKVKNCQGKEAFQRMNFLYQASNLMANGISTGASTYYGNLMVNVAKRTVLRIDPHIKRTLCKRCRSLLIPGQSCRVRINDKMNCIVVTCEKCFAVKRYPTRPDYKLWSDRAEAVVEMLDYALNNTREKQTQQEDTKYKGKKEKKTDNKSENTLLKYDISETEKNVKNFDGEIEIKDEIMKDNVEDVMKE